MIKSGHIETGRNGEKRARDYLISVGYEILETNFRSGREEIDIIARDKEDIVFVEVKTRRDYRCGPPAAAVHWKKRERLRRVAGVYLAMKGYLDYPARFDVVAITLKDDSINLIQGAF